jgi:tRNA(Ile)-lysidine synthase
VTAERPAPLAGLLGRCTFPPPGTRLDCAVSGGADSLALLALAVEAGCEAVAWHVDHGLRPGSAAESGVVAASASRLGAEFCSRRFEVPPGPNLEARARAARRAVLPSGAATGHTADDQAETVLLNLLRGAGADGLAGMSAGHRHPILGLRRSETRTLVDSLGLEVVDDPFNRDPSFTRNRVRHDLIPLCSAVARRDVVPLLNRQASLLAEETALLEQLAAVLDPTDARALRAAPAPLARRALRRWLRSGPEAHPPSSASVERVLAVARGDHRACEIEGGRAVRRSRGRLELVVAEAL